MGKRGGRKKRKLDLNSTAYSGGSPPELSGEGSMVLNLSYLCPICENEVSEQDESIECYRCEKWIHFRCSDLTRERFEVLRESTDSMQFFCECCVIKNRMDKESQKSGTYGLSSASTTRDNAHTFTGGGACGGACGGLESRLDAMMAKLCSLETKITKLDSIETGAQLDKKIKTVVDKELTAALDERDEIDKRKRNLVVFGMKESSGTSDAEKIRNDVIRVRTMISKMEPELANIRIVDPVRLQSEKNKDKPRLLKFKVENEDIKERIVRGSIRVNKTVDKDRQIYFNNDFTPKQRAAHKELKEQLKEKKRVTGEDDWVIRGRDIVKKPKPRTSPTNGPRDDRVNRHGSPRNHQSQQGNNQQQQHNQSTRPHQSPRTDMRSPGSNSGRNSPGGGQGGQ